MNFASQTLFTGVVYYLSFAFLFPHSDLNLGMILSAVLLLPYTISLSMAVIAMPRSGSDYVFIGRSLHPGLGFMAALEYIVWFGYFSGAFTNWIFTSGLAPMLSVIGSVTGSPVLQNLSAAVTEPTLVVVGGTIIILLTGALAIVSRKWTARLDGIMVLLSLVSLVICVGAFYATSSQAFQSAFNAYSQQFTSDPNYYNTIMDTATKNGFTSGTFSLADTLAMTPYGAFIFLFVLAMQGIAGEIKNPTKTLWSAATVTIIVACLMSIVGVASYSLAVTPTFGNAINFVYANGLGYNLPVAPTFNFLASLAVNNVILVWLINIGLVATSVALLINFYLYATRYFLATAFDRILPEKLADVSDRFHSPHIAAIVSIIIAIVTLVIFTYFASYAYAMSGTLGQLLFGMLIFGFATIFFPYSKRTREIYRASPVNKSLAGVPVIAIIGVLNVVCLGYLSYIMLVNSVYAVNSTTSLVAIVLVAVVAWVWYFARRAYLKSRGIDLDMIFVQLPPE